MLKRSGLTSLVSTFILAGAEGKRLYPLTRERAKAIVPFGAVTSFLDSYANAAWPTSGPAGRNRPEFDQSVTCSEASIVDSLIPKNVSIAAGSRVFHSVLSPGVKIERFGVLSSYLQTTSVGRLSTSEPKRLGTTFAQDNHPPNEAGMHDEPKNNSSCGRPLHHS